MITCSPQQIFALSMNGCYQYVNPIQTFTMSKSSSQKSVNGNSQKQYEKRSLRKSTSSKQIQPQIPVSCPERQSLPETKRQYLNNCTNGNLENCFEVREKIRINKPVSHYKVQQKLANQIIYSNQRQIKNTELDFVYKKQIQRQNPIIQYPFFSENEILKGKNSKMQMSTAKNSMRGSIQSIEQTKKHADDNQYLIFSKMAKAEANLASLKPKLANSMIEGEEAFEDQMSEVIYTHSHHYASKKLPNGKLDFQL